MELKELGRSRLRIAWRRFIKERRWAGRQRKSFKTSEPERGGEIHSDSLPSGGGVESGDRILREKKGKAG
jgi:hypothetical protein